MTAKSVLLRLHGACPHLSPLLDYATVHRPTKPSTYNLIGITE